MARKKRPSKDKEVIFNERELEESRIRKKFHAKDLTHIIPKTETQKDVFDSWEEDKNLFLFGSAGTGKTFLALFLSFRDLLAEKYDKVYVVRSAVSSRDIGALPGTKEEKIAEYEAPYNSICNELFSFGKAYDNLKKVGKVEFLPTSFLRGRTLDNCIVIADEVQNMSFEEADTIITRMGENSKIIFCGDGKQNDLHFHKYDKSGFDKFLSIIENMIDYFDCIEFFPEDIVRSGLVKSYILEKENMGL